MSIKKMLTAAAIATLCTTATRAGAQVSVLSSCSPGIPDCTSLRFFLDAASSDVAVDQLFITLLSPAWTFTGGPQPTVGTYSAQDDIGPFSGFTTISNGGTTAAINFLDNGFPFQLFATQSGFLDLTAAGTGDATGLQFEVVGKTDDGGTFVFTTATPEPSTIVLVATGLVALVGVTWRRRRGARDVAVV